MFCYSDQQEQKCLCCPRNSHQSVWAGRAVIFGVVSGTWRLTLSLWHSCFLLCVLHQFRTEGRAAGADGGPQRAAADPEEAAGEGVWGRSPEEHRTAAGRKILLIVLKPLHACGPPNLLFSLWLIIALLRTGLDYAGLFSKCSPTPEHLKVQKLKENSCHHFQNSNEKSRFNPVCV